MELACRCTGPELFVANIVANHTDDIKSELDEQQHEHEYADLWMRLRVSGDKSARTQLFEHYLWLSRAIAIRIIEQRSISRKEFMDAAQSAAVGLLQSIDRYDPSMGIKFVNYARPRISGELHDYLSGATEAQRQISYRRDFLESRAHSLVNETSIKKQTNKLFSDNLFADMVDIAVGLAVGFLLEDTNLFASVEVEEQKTPYASIDMAMLREHLHYIVESLPVTHQRVIRYHYYHEINFSTIADTLGLTRARISQIHADAIKKIRQIYDTVGSFDTTT